MKDGACGQPRGSTALPHKELSVVGLVDASPTALVNNYLVLRSCDASGK